MMNGYDDGSSSTPYHPYDGQQHQTYRTHYGVASINPYSATPSDLGFGPLTPAPASLGVPGNSQTAAVGTNALPSFSHVSGFTGYEPAKRDAPQYHQFTVAPQVASDHHQHHQLAPPKPSYHTSHLSQQQFQQHPHFSGVGTVGSANASSLLPLVPSEDVPSKPTHEISLSNSGIPGAVTSASLSIMDETSKKEEPKDELMITISSLSEKPLKASEVLERVSSRANDVITRYLPCVDFLVTCQQELRQALAATKRPGGGRISTKQFYKNNLEPLPNRFFNKYRRVMSASNLNEATEQISSLCQDAKRVDHLGCEQMKNAFLGGMRDGESWGLRRWLSKNGAALYVCNDFELILTSMQKLDTDDPKTVELAASLRREAAYAKKRLVADVPKAYQEFSSAHPYLPFFHRLEAALKGLAEFDPEDDDVVIIEDVDVEEEKKKAEKRKKEKEEKKAEEDRKREAEGGDSGNEMFNENSFHSRKKGRFDAGEPAADFNDTEGQGASTDNNFAASGGDNSDDSDCEVVLVKPPLGDSNAFDNDERKQRPASANDQLYGTDANAGHDSNGLQSNGNFDDAPEDQDVGRSLTSSPGESFLTGGDGRIGDAMKLNEAVRQMVAADQNNSENGANNENRGDWRCPECIFLNLFYNDTCLMCETKRDDALGGGNSMQGSNPSQNQSTAASTAGSVHMSPQDLADEMAKTVEGLNISAGHRAREDFWDAHWSFVISLFATVLRRSESKWFLEPITGDKLASYRHVVKNPLSFRCIINALSSEKNSGRLSSTLPFNVTRGRDLLQAIDLVFLNALAYNGKAKTELRTDTLKVRRYFWDRIRKKAAIDPTQIPTKRGETSGFVIVKDVMRHR